MFENYDHQQSRVEQTVYCGEDVKTDGDINVAEKQYWHPGSD